jgi:hypothetical protein
MAKEQPIDERLDEIREDDGQIYVERDKVDFDPDEGLLAGTAIDGTSDIPDDPESVADAEKSDGESDEASEQASDEASDKTSDEAPDKASDKASEEQPADESAE